MSPDTGRRTFVSAQQSPALLCFVLPSPTNVLSRHMCTHTRYPSLPPLPPFPPTLSLPTAILSPTASSDGQSEDLTYSLEGELPPGFSFNTTSGVLFGAPQEPGQYQDIIVFVTNQKTGGYGLLAVFDHIRNPPSLAAHMSASTSVFLRAKVRVPP